MAERHSYNFNKSISALVKGVFLIGVLFIINQSQSYAYTIKGGDTLSKIAAEYNMTIEEILALNSNIDNPDLIFEGQEINLGETGQNTTGPLSGYSRASLSNDDKAALQEMFDPDYYAEVYPDVVSVYGNDSEKLFEHFLDYGLWETRQPNRGFNINAYISSYDDLIDAFGGLEFGERVKQAYLHYSIYGITENRTSTTIERCLGMGRSVLYYGAYESGTGVGYDNLDLIAEVPAAEDEGDIPSSNPPARRLYSDVLRGYMHEELKHYYESIQNIIPAPWSGKYNELLAFDVLNSSDALSNETYSALWELRDEYCSSEIDQLRAQGELGEYDEELCGAFFDDYYDDVIVPRINQTLPFLFQEDISVQEVYAILNNSGYDDLIEVGNALNSCGVGNEEVVNRFVELLFEAWDEDELLISYFCG